ncbi:MAG: protein kinase [Alphaproteobacteria bacterium]|nr:protein kinase [Alphaproteobacteria bacterium]
MTDRFEEKDEIGEGGMSVVMRAFDRILARETAHKVLKPRYLHSPRHIDRFTTEAQTTGQLEHPNIVPVHEFGQSTDGTYFINMKLVEGATLESMVEQAGDERLHPDRMGEMVQILLKVCDALSFAHSRGVVHRDLKPSNIMVGQFGEVYLMDWGVAVRVEQPGGIDDLTGTPAFMAPEQVSGEGIDARTDVFALGATLYFCVTGQAPYPGPTAIQALTQALDCAWTPLHEVLGDRAPPGIDVILGRAMTKRPDDRYATVAEMKRDLDQWLRGRWHLPTRSYAPGEVVVQEGDAGDEAFIIVSGTCVVTKQIGGESVELTRMGPGDVFGEMAIFSQQNRTSTVTAVDALGVQVVTRKTLAAATGLDSWVGKFITALAQRFLDAEEKLHQR